MPGTLLLVGGLSKRFALSVGAGGAAGELSRESKRWLFFVAAGAGFRFAEDAEGVELGA